MQLIKINIMAVLVSLLLPVASYGASFGAWSPATTNSQAYTACFHNAGYVGLLGREWEMIAIGWIGGSPILFPAPALNVYDISPAFDSPIIVGVIGTHDGIANRSIPFDYRERWVSIGGKSNAFGYPIGTTGVQGGCRVKPD